MKINEKNLATYSVSRDHIDKEGYLLKKAETNHTFNRRWFVLKGNLLFYFERKSDKEPSGLLILEGCTPELAESDDLHLFKLIYAGYEHCEYQLAADSHEDLLAWMKSISRASHDYIRLMVAELQKQLNDIEATDVTANDGLSRSFSARVSPRKNPFDEGDRKSSYSDLWTTSEPRNTFVGRTSSLNLYNPSSKNIPHRPAPPPPPVTVPVSQTRKKIPSEMNVIKEIGNPLFADIHFQYGIRILEDMESHSQSKLPPGESNLDAFTTKSGSLFYVENDNVTSLSQSDAINSKCGDQNSHIKDSINNFDTDCGISKINIESKLSLSETKDNQNYDSSQLLSELTEFESSTSSVDAIASLMSMECAVQEITKVENLIDL